MADNCIIDGSIENCIVFSGARIRPGAKLKDCIVMSDCIVEPGCVLDHCIIDKDCSFSAGTVLTGNESLPIIVPKGTSI